MVKKTAISQAKSSITSEHTRNTCGLASAAPLEIEKERRRERESEGGRSGQKKREAESTEFFSANRLLN